MDQWPPFLVLQPQAGVFLWSSLFPLVVCLLPSLAPGAGPGDQHTGAGLGRVKTKVAEAGGGAPDTRPPGPRCWARARPPSGRLLFSKRAMQRKAFTFYIRYSPDYSCLMLCSGAIVLVVLTGGCERGGGIGGGAGGAGGGGAVGEDQARWKV